MQPSAAPLAARLRPRQIHEYLGQAHLLAKGKPLREAIESGVLHSMILWGPPGTGKTTLANLLCQAADAQLLKLSAVLSGVKEIRQAIEQAQQAKQDGRASVLFVDEVHRFNKSQQDAFLPYVEDGTITFIGATTENPSFELNHALLSRARVYVLQKLHHQDLSALIEQALQSPEQWGYPSMQIDAQARQWLIDAADGDARRLLNLLEVAGQLAQPDDDGQCALITPEAAKNVIGSQYRSFDKGGDQFYDQISALHKSVRGSDPDAALYWFARMLEGGCDALYIARRALAIASEDIGNADPRAMQVALNAWQAYHHLGAAEGERAIAQALVYLAAAPKSNAVYTAFKQAKQDAKHKPSYDVPNHLRNAPTRLMSELGYGQDYRYAHDEPNAFAAGECYFPAEMAGTRYYYPQSQGLEIKIKQKLDHLATLNQSSQTKRYTK